MINQQKVLSSISSRDHFQKLLLSQISETLRARFDNEGLLHEVLKQ